MNTQQDKDWLAMLRAIAKLADKMEATKAEPDNEWSEADDATLLEQFDPWQTLREAETALEQAAPQMEVVPDGWYPHNNGDGIRVDGCNIGQVIMGRKAWVYLPDGWLLMRPATVASEVNDED